MMRKYLFLYFVIIVTTLSSCSQIQIGNIVSEKKYSEVSFQTSSTNKQSDVSENKSSLPIYQSRR